MRTSISGSEQGRQGRQNTGVRLGESRAGSRCTEVREEAPQSCRCARPVGGTLVPAGRPGAGQMGAGGRTSQSVTDFMGW